MDPEGNEVKFFSSEFLVRKYLKMSDADLRLNKKLSEQEREEAQEFADVEGDNYVTSRLATAGYGDGAETKGTASAHSDWQAGYRMDGIAPRLFKTNVGDIFTTNMVETGASITYSQGDILHRH